MAAQPVRMYSNQELVVGTTVSLSAEQAKQLARVLRREPGDPVELFNGDGTNYRGKLVAVTSRTVTVVVDATGPGPDLFHPSLDLYQALIKQDKFDWVVQKATELGVNRIIPLMTERSVVSLPVDRARKRVERWRRVAQEAAEQSGRTTIPEIRHPIEMADLEGWENHTLPIVCWEMWDDVAESLVTIDFTGFDRVAVIVGPEGGFTEREVEQLEVQGTRLVTLGPLILRSETAAIHATGLVRSRCWTR